MGWETFELTSPKQGPVAALQESVDGFDFFRTVPTRFIFFADTGIGRNRVDGPNGASSEAVVDQVKPDVLHAHSLVPNAIPALWVGRPAYRWSMKYAPSGKMARSTMARPRQAALRYRLSRGLKTYALKRVDAITTICEDMRNEIVAPGNTVEQSDGDPQCGGR